jgi:signal transduction histidine kinase
MSDVDLTGRLAALPSFADIPGEELTWLAAHGELVGGEAGAVAASKGRRIEHLWILLSGHVAIRVDHGAGLHRVMEWRAGDVGGMLPYSRMTVPPGDTYFEKKTELLLIHEKHFPEMIRRCPLFIALTVHSMVDRARAFNASELQDEKMVSLGKLAAGLAHELNNPASSLVRNAGMLLESLVDADSAARAFGRMIRDEVKIEAVEKTHHACMAASDDRVLSPVELADREDVFAGWLTLRQLDPDYAVPLAETPVTIEALDALADAVSGRNLEAALHWITAGCGTRTLVHDIERAAVRIYDLVAAVKRFTYMDRLSAPDSADVEACLRDTLRVLASKAREKNASITLDVERDLPRVQAHGGALNQVWLNLIDNALDAIPSSGHIRISARREHDWIVVHLTDNGTGIPADILSRIFDPFFTTKPPGQGTGLGLDISRRLLRRYHGDISVASQPGYTEFVVRLPVVPVGDGPI